MTLHQCEWPGTGPDLADVRCRRNGDVFFRALSGWGHWLCSEHRDAWRASDSARTHGTRPERARMGQKDGACRTCGQPVVLRRDGIWIHQDTTEEGAS